MERTEKGNAELHDFYQGIYAKDKNRHFLKYRDGKILSEAHEKVIAWLREGGPRHDEVLDFGCGEADFLGHFPPGPRRVGIDYSENAIANAKAKYPGLELVCGLEKDLVPFASSMDLVFSFGVLEHMDDPRSTLGSLFACAKDDGLVVVSCPSFLNVRGVIWMTLALLWGVPMSLSDRHFLTLQDFKDMASSHGGVLVEAFSADLSVGQGADFGRDMRKRLTNALRDAKLDNSGVEKAVQWFERNLPDYAAGELSGAETVYVFEKRR